VVHAISLGLTLFVTWLLLSGYFVPLLITFGILSVILVVFIAHRMDVVDRESHPVHLTFVLPGYWLWLLKEIVLSSIDVTRRVLAPKLRISPTLVRVKATQQSDLGKVIYANSITLTPGTVTLDMDGDVLLVHALSREGAASLEEGEMDRRVTRLEGDLPPGTEARGTG